MKRVEQLPSEKMHTLLATEQPGAINEALPFA